MRRAALSALMLLGLAWRAAAQAPADTANAAAMQADLAHIRADLEIVKSQLAQVLRIVGQRPTAAAGVTPSAPVRANVADAPAMGRADAPVTLVEFSDYQCPFCQRFFATTLPVLKTEYIDTGKLRYVFRDYPLDIHAQARKAAEAAHCAGDQGKYWEMHDALFQHQGSLAVPQLAEQARAVGVDGADFDQCLFSGRHAAQVGRGVADGAATGVQGTPGFVVARSKAGDVVEGTFVRGAQPVEVFRRIIEQLLNDSVADTTKTTNHDSAK